MVFAADYPFLNIFWTMILFFTWVVWIWMMVAILSDVFRRRDMSGWGKAAWTVFLIVLPFVGALIYLISNHDGMADRDVKQHQAAQAEFDDYVKTVAKDGGGGAAPEIEKARALLDSGAIDQSEFERSSPRRSRSAAARNTGGIIDAAPDRRPRRRPCAPAALVSVNRRCACADAARRPPCARRRRSGSARAGGGGRSAGCARRSGSRCGACPRAPCVLQRAEAPRSGRSAAGR